MINLRLCLLKPENYDFPFACSGSKAKKPGISRGIVERTYNSLRVHGSKTTICQPQLRETWNGHRIVELEGPHRVTPNEIAGTFANLLGRPVRVGVVPREIWESLFMRNPTPRIQMLDGFNEGRIEFQGGHAGPHKGNVTLETVLGTLIERESKL